MRYLYIDTSSSYLYTSIIENDKLLSEIKREYGQQLSKIALPEIVSMFKKNNLKPTDIDKIIVVNGPGSFTGIRIGITIAKVYAWSCNIPITTITSLEAMAISSSNNSFHVPVINARRGKVYAAIYNTDYKEILKPQHIEIEILKKRIEKLSNYEIITNDQLKEFTNKKTYNPNILKITNFFKDKEIISPHLVNPNYLKLTEAEEKNAN